MESYSINSRIPAERGGTMDIPSLSVTRAQNMSLTTVGTLMLDKSLETLDAVGQGMIEMLDAAAMERSVNPHIGSNFDMFV